MDMVVVGGWDMECARGIRCLVQGCGNTTLLLVATAPEDLENPVTDP